MTPHRAALANDFFETGYGENLARVNGWDEQVILNVRNHPIFRGLNKVADMEMHRHQMLDAAALIEQYRGVVDLLGEPHPAFELGLRWLDVHVADLPDRPDALVRAASEALRSP